MKPTVLIYSADPDFVLVFGHILAVAGFDTALVHDAAQVAQAVTTKTSPIALVMDCLSRDRKAAKLCAAVKAAAGPGTPPIVALMAPNAGNMHVEMLAAGVDESFARPFAPEQLLLWLQAQLRGRETSLTTNAGDLVHGDLRLEQRTGLVRFAEKEIALPPIEFRLLRRLMAEPGTVFSREELIKSAWPERAADADLRSVDVHVARLRKRLKAAIGRELVRTVRSAGYAFAPDW